MKIEPWHQVGQLVRCVDGSHRAEGPVQGTLYFVRDVITEHVDQACFRLEELRLAPRLCVARDGTSLGVIEPVFSASRFEPVRQPPLDALRMLLRELA